MCLPTMTQVGCEHTTQYISLVHADALRIAPQRQTITLLVFLHICYGTLYTRINFFSMIPQTILKIISFINTLKSTCTKWEDISIESDWHEVVCKQDKWPIHDCKIMDCQRHISFIKSCPIHKMHKKRNSWEDINVFKRKDMFFSCGKIDVQRINSTQEMHQWTMDSTRCSTLMLWCPVLWCKMYVSIRQLFRIRWIAADHSWNNYIPHTLTLKVLVMTIYALGHF